MTRSPYEAPRRERSPMAGSPSGVPRRKGPVMTRPLYEVPPWERAPMAGTPCGSPVGRDR